MQTNKFLFRVGNHDWTSNLDEIRNSVKTKNLDKTYVEVKMVHSPIKTERLGRIPLKMAYVKYAL